MIEFLKKLEIFQDLEEPKIKKLADMIQPLDFSENEVVFKQGDPADAFYMIKEGKVKVVKEMDGEQKVIVELGPGSFFGEMALIEGKPRNATIICTTDAKLLKLTKNNFNLLIGSNPSILLKIFSYMSERIRKEKAEATADEPKGDEKKQKLAKIIAFFSAKGGVGKSIISSNVAYILANQYKKNVLLWDLSLQFGCQTFIFNTKASPNIVNLISDESEISEESIQEYVIKVENGPDILAAPDTPEKAEIVTMQHIVQILSILKQKYEYLIVDLPARFEDSVITILDHATLIILILTLEIPTVILTKKCLTLMKSLRYTDDKIQLLANQICSKTELTSDLIEEKLEKKVLGTIPNADKEIVSAINRGVPVVELAPNSTFSKTMFEFCEALAQKKEKEVEKKQEGILSKLMFWK